MGLMCLLIAHLVQCWSSLCLHPESRLLLSCFYIASLWLQQFLWEGHRQEVICSIFPLCMESNAWEKLTNNIVATRFLACTPKIWWIVKICDVVDQFHQKLFWFLQNIFTIFCSMQLHCRALEILAAMDVRVIPW